MDAAGDGREERLAASIAIEKGRRFAGLFCAFDLVAGFLQAFALGLAQLLAILPVDGLARFARLFLDLAGFGVLGRGLVVVTGRGLVAFAFVALAGVDVTVLGIHVHSPLHVMK